MTIGYLSGTFDLFHIGHLNLIRRAKEQCDYLIVAVHDSGKWKGKETFIPFEERKEIVGACRYVDQVVDSPVEDSDAWELYHFDKLFVGSDYKGTERFNRYEEFFKDKGVEIVYFPYTQSTSSTQIRALINSALGKK
jgi:glycerol-3-phosphate cytidylyltransferase